MTKKGSFLPRNSLFRGWRCMSGNKTDYSEKDSRHGLPPLECLGTHSRSPPSALTYFCLQWLTEWLPLSTVYIFREWEVLRAELLASDSARYRDKKSQPPCLTAGHKLMSRLSLLNEQSTTSGTLSKATLAQSISLSVFLSPSCANLFWEHFLNKTLCYKSSSQGLLPGA